MSDPADDPELLAIARAGLSALAKHVNGGNSKVPNSISIPVKLDDDILAEFNRCVPRRTPELLLLLQIIRLLRNAESPVVVAETNPAPPAAPENP